MLLDLTTRFLSFVRVSQLLRIQHQHPNTCSTLQVSIVFVPFMSDLVKLLHCEVLTFWNTLVGI